MCECGSFFVSLISRTGGILPQDTAAVRREQLRRERQADYQEFLRAQQRIPTTTSHPHLSSSPSHHPQALPAASSFSSVAEKRRVLARERERELANQDRLRPLERDYKPDSPLGRERGRADGRWREDSSARMTQAGYDRSRKQRLEEERKYGGHFWENLSPSHGSRREGSWEERGREGEGGGAGQVRFEDDEDGERLELHEPRRGGEQPRRWDEEEEDLMQWARGQGKSWGPTEKISRAPTPPMYSSPPRKQVELKGSRSLSAPVIAGSITALGAGDALETKRRRQKEYAEQLQAQMREKEEARERERERGRQRQGERGEEVSRYGQQGKETEREIGRASCRERV